MRHTISSTTGNSVSTALANGWISSGQVLSHNQSILAQLEQKLRSEVHGAEVGLPRSLVAVYFLDGSVRRGDRGDIGGIISTL
jgi:hypothetical protein